MIISLSSSAIRETISQRDWRIQPSSMSCNNRAYPVWVYDYDKLTLLIIIMVRKRVLGCNYLFICLLLCSCRIIAGDNKKYCVYFVIGHINNIPQCNYWMELPEILSQNIRAIIDYVCLGIPIYCMTSYIWVW